MTTNRVIAVLLALFVTFPAHATIVQFQTVLGNFEVNLYDESTPATVENFLSYVNGDDYAEGFVHRSVPGFVIQGGGFAYRNGEVAAVSSRAPVQNEPRFANLRGTIAMAKIAGDPDSATSQWFINLADNTGALDGQNGGFTVFGEVTGDGMDIVDAIAALPRYNFGSPFGELPLRNYSDGSPTEEHYVMLLGVAVIDAATDTAAGLDPEPNTVIAQSGGGEGGGGGGGSGALTASMSLLLAWGLRRRRAQRISGT